MLPWNRGSARGLKYACRTGSQGSRGVGSCRTPGRALAIVAAIRVAGHQGGQALLRLPATRQPHVASRHQGGESSEIVSQMRVDGKDAGRGPVSEGAKPG